MSNNTNSDSIARNLAIKHHNNDEKKIEKRTKDIQTAEGVGSIQNIGKALEKCTLDRSASDLPSRCAIADLYGRDNSNPMLQVPTRSRNIVAPASVPKALAFRSYKNGTLITNNFLPAGRPKQQANQASPTKQLGLFPGSSRKQTELSIRPTVLSPRSPESTPSVSSPGLSASVTQPHITRSPLLHIDYPEIIRSETLKEFLYSTKPRFEKLSRAIGQQVAPAPSHFSTNSGNKKDSSQIDQNNLCKLKSLINTIPRGPTKNDLSTGSQLWQSTDGSYHSFHEIKLPPQVPRTWTERAEPYKKDILISIDSITHNIHRMKADYDASGKECWQVVDDYNPERYDLVEAVKKLSENQKEAFWMQNWIGITVNFGNRAETITESIEEALNPLYPITRFRRSILETLRKLGKETGMYEYALSIFITIICPLQNDPKENFKTLTKKQQRSPEFREVVDLAREMNKFTKINKMEVILMNVPGVRARLTIEQLNYALPFYDCNFENWSLMWQNEYMTQAESVQNWPITYLDREMYKVHQERARFGERLNNGGRDPANPSPNSTRGDFNYGVEYRADNELQDITWVRSDARGYRYEHRHEAEKAPKRPLEYYRHP